MIVTLGCNRLQIQGKAVPADIIAGTGGVKRAREELRLPEY